MTCVDDANKGQNGEILATCPHLYKLFKRYLLSCPFRAVSGALTQLKGMAVDMGGELDRQSSQVDRIKTKTDINEAHLSHSNYRIRRQL